MFICNDCFERWKSATLAHKSCAMVLEGLINQNKSSSSTLFYTVYPDFTAPCTAEAAFRRELLKTERIASPRFAHTHTHTLSARPVIVRLATYHRSRLAHKQMQCTWCSTYRALTSNSKTTTAKARFKTDTHKHMASWIRAVLQHLDVLMEGPLLLLEGLLLAWHDWPTECTLVTSAMTSPSSQGSASLHTP